jgi:hypothetical protein
VERDRAAVGRGGEGALANFDRGDVDRARAGGWHRAPAGLIVRLRIARRGADPAAVACLAGDRVVGEQAARAARAAPHG